MLTRNVSRKPMTDESDGRIPPVAVPRAVRITADRHFFEGDGAKRRPKRVKHAVHVKSRQNPLEMDHNSNALEQDGCVYLCTT